MKRLVACGILTFGLLALPMLGTASAQNTGYETQHEMNQPRPNQNAGDQMRDQMRNETRKDADWGWLGLIGLGGLAGLLRRPQVDETTRQRASGYRTGEPLGSR
jgi:MYXO-CTERM domain-containing protein